MKRSVFWETFSEFWRPSTHTVPQGQCVWEWSLSVPLVSQAAGEASVLLCLGRQGGNTKQNCFLLYMRIGEGNGTPLQYSWLKNPMDGGAWWATVHGVTKSWTRLRDFPFPYVKIFLEWKSILFENKWWKGATPESSTILCNICGLPDNTSRMMLGKADRADLRHPVGVIISLLVPPNHCAPPAMPLSILGHLHWPLVRHWELSLAILFFFHFPRRIYWNV